MKIAIVDLGSNTVRLSVYHTQADGRFDLLFSEKEMAGLVSYVQGGVLTSQGIRRACQAIQDFQVLLRQLEKRMDGPTNFELVVADPLVPGEGMHIYKQNPNEPNSDYRSRKRQARADEALKSKRPAERYTRKGGPRK